MFIRLGDIYIDPFKVEAIFPDVDNKDHSCLLVTTSSKIIKAPVCAAAAVIRIEDALADDGEDGNDY